MDTDERTDQNNMESKVLETVSDKDAAKHAKFETDPTRITKIDVKKVEPENSLQGACFVQIYGDDLGKKFDIAHGMTIGRENERDIVLNKDCVSRRHARIEMSANEVIIIDEGSTNGTYVNDVPIQTSRLRTGDFIKVGDTIFKYLAGGNIETSYHEEIYKMTIIDGLTQIHNKRYLLEFLDKEISRSLRYHRDLSLIIFDLDFFKSINDQYGHLIGDFILKDLAKIIKARIRKEELFARYGGEEFVVVLSETSLKGAFDFGEKIRGLVEHNIFRYEENSQIPVTISVGVATLDNTIVTPEQLLKRADENLYRAKKEGRNRVVG